ncbi:MAG: RNA-binding domain-containing protein [Bacteroidota bacterium]
MDLAELRRLVRQGEGQHLEFKRKARHPDKIARELIAFANSSGGTLYVGVDDNLSIYGVKFPEEDIFAIGQYLEKFVYPTLPIQVEKIKISSTHTVIAYHTKASSKKPHFLKPEDKEGKKLAFVRVDDMSITASREMVELLRHEQRKKGVHLRVGEREKGILAYLEEQSRISLAETQKLLNLNKRTASTILILLVRAGLLQIHPSEKGDTFSLSEEAFG